MANVPLIATFADQTATQAAGAASQLVPPGAIMSYGGANAPIGWLLCDGAAISRTVYANLFSAISLTGTTTFASSTHAHALLRGTGQTNYLVVRGVASGGNDVLIQSQSQNTESRTGDTTANASNASVGISSTSAGNGNLGVSGKTANNGTLAVANGDNETRPINIALNAIIKI